MLFLGDIVLDEIKKYLDELYLPCQIGLPGYFNKCLFWPETNPRLVAYQADFFEKNIILDKFHEEIFEFFKERKVLVKLENRFIPHVTICRDDFNLKLWKETFKQSPLYIKSFNLYESLQNSEYNILWTKDFINPFEEIKHTADIAFIIRGKSYLDLLHSSFIALSFKVEIFLNYVSLLKKVNSIDDVIINLNEIITNAEIDGFDIPFKAVSFHNKIDRKNEIMNWEMIVDV